MSSSTAPTSVPQTPSLNNTYGAMLIGVLFATFLQGCLTLQTIMYYDSYPKDPISTKLVVAIVWCLDTFHLVLIAQSTYHYLIDNWGVLEALGFSTWELDLNVVFIGLSSFVCQVFFLKRIWVFSKKNIFLVAFLATLCATTLVLDVVVTVQITQNRSVTEFGKRKGEIIAVFTSGAIADVALTSVLCYYIQRSGRGGFGRTNSLIGFVIKYAVTTGLLTSLLGVFTLIAYFASPAGFIFIAMHFSLGRLYTNALLATLNSRSKIRAAILKPIELNGNLPNSRDKQTRTGVGSMSIPLSNSEVQNAQHTHVQVHTVTETVQSGYSYNLELSEGHGPIHSHADMKCSSDLGDV
ncbi:hypothetical protein FB446DRAFT_774270 [Lentinula raphanica]|nr:hypothetical protein FB446DRAFT_774270 [Lentinula raphanica]